MASDSTSPPGSGASESWIEARRLEAIGRLLPSVLHQLATPLASIALRAESLERVWSGADAGSDEKARRYLQAIATESSRCQELLALTRSFVRPVSPEAGMVDLNAICREAVRLALHEAMRRQVEPSVAPDEKLPGVWGRDGHLRQAVLEMVVAALEGAEAGGRVVLATQSDEGMAVVRASGLPARARLEPPRAACAIAESHGGRLDLEEGPPGRCLVLRLPAGVRPGPVRG